MRNDVRSHSPCKNSPGKPVSADVKGKQLKGAGVLVPVVFAALALLGCTRKEDDQLRAQQAAYQKQLEDCSRQLSKDPRIPIIGGGYLDTSRFAFNKPTVRFEDGQCGTDGFETDFFWTGDRILPQDQRFTGVHPTQVPKHWRLFVVAASLGNQRKFRQCQATPDLEKCAFLHYKNPGLPPTWPEELIVRPKAYPDLQIWIRQEGYAKKTQSLSFVITDLKRRDGVAPRTFFCFALKDYEPSLMTKADLEDIDFGERTFPCQFEFPDFFFKGGAARVFTGTEALRDMKPAIQALQQYISDSFIQEESK